MDTLHAPSRWQCIDFISDLHLQVCEPDTFNVWSEYLQHTTANAVFILGDLFEVWVGDDVLADADSFESQCVQVLQTAATRLDVFLMHGNRDFLMGERLMHAGGCTLMPDPTVLHFAEQRWLLTHGDALCLDDTAYQQFRQWVRSAVWQTEFLNTPLAERKALVRQMRSQSESVKQTTVVYADVDSAAATAWLHTHHASTMIHGHTHRPGAHALGPGRERLVLSDWDVCAQPTRAEVLRMRYSPHQPQGCVVVERISPKQACASSPTPAD